MPDKTIKAFGAHLNKLRKEKKLSFQELAYAAEMDKGQVQKICRGTDPRMTTLIRLAKGLKVPIQELFKF